MDHLSIGLLKRAREKLVSSHQRLTCIKIRLLTSSSFLKQSLAIDTHQKVSSSPLLIQVSMSETNLTNSP